MSGNTLSNHLNYTRVFPSQEIENARRTRAFNLFSAAGAGFLLVFGFHSLAQGEQLLAYMLLSMSVFTGLNALVLLLSKNYRLACHGASIIISVNFLFLIITGGTDNTGPLWCYTFSPLLLFIQGGVRGALIVSLLLLITAGLFYYPETPWLMTVYSDSFKSRFIASYADVTIMAFLYEYSRQRAYNKLKTLSQQMYNASRTDGLTGLTNRRAMLEILEAEHARALRHHHPYTLIIGDLDHFKTINDTLGHTCGDLVLKEVAKLLSQCLRKQDVVARWGGEEFLILLPELGAAASAQVAEKIRHSVETLKLRCHEEEIHLTISLGAHTGELSGHYDEFIKQADTNLYSAKDGGRNCVIVTPEPQTTQ